MLSFEDETAEKAATETDEKPAEEKKEEAVKVSSKTKKTAPRKTAGTRSKFSCPFPNTDCPISGKNPYVKEC